MSHFSTYRETTSRFSARGLYCAIALIKKHKYFPLFKPLPTRVTKIILKLNIRMPFEEMGEDFYANLT
uniref:Uncharacterized protein n=1 Tax=Pararge aegeria TaxID=116150 RepID=S4PV52_9NEOP